MKIINGKASIDTTELGGLTAEEFGSLQRRASIIGITVKELLEAAITDTILSAVEVSLAEALGNNREVSVAFVRADAATQDSIKTLLGVPLTVSAAA